MIELKILTEDEISNYVDENDEIRYLGDFDFGDFIGKEFDVRMHKTFLGELTEEEINELINSLYSDFNGEYTIDSVFNSIVRNIEKLQEGS